ncbi:hypothetical protein HW561_03475 [Rhodobacteraceae bacterium B1Z28]|uniref:Uncharacterized protein n=1 Tax=Ruegeria haliotis TaxID=2747601 RepID=A0ABX2PMN4_9RHOB|nr:hypothetical protein [Ruegeria haliotis]NVO54847.1 hypothetical protein [Ruegeria haliotis]
MTLTADATGTSAGLVCGLTAVMGFTPVVGFASVLATGVAATRGLAEKSATDLAFDFTATVLATGFFAAGAALTTLGFVRFAAGLGFTDDFSGAGAGTDAAACKAWIGAIGSSIAVRAMICMIFIWLTIV